LQPVDYHFVVAVRRAKDAESTHMNTRNAIVAILAALSPSLALADDFKTINGKEYKNVTVSRVEADGIVIKTKTGLSKIYFAELPKDVQERFHYGSSTPVGKPVTQRIDEAESAKPPAAFLDAAESALQTANEKFVQRVEKKLDERELILQGKHTPGPAELSVIREFNFHWVFLAVIAIVAIVLFTVVWRRFQ
jgi:hypothetical protein